MTTNFVTFAALLAGLTPTAFGSTGPGQASSALKSDAINQVRILADDGSIDTDEFFLGGGSDCEMV